MIYNKTWQEIHVQGNEDELQVDTYDKDVGGVEEDDGEANEKITKYMNITLTPFRSIRIQYKTLNIREDIRRQKTREHRVILHIKMTLFIAIQNSGLPWTVGNSQLMEDGPPGAMAP